MDADKSDGTKPAYQRGRHSSVTNGTRLLLPSELKARKKANAKDWGECMLTFDKIQEPVRAADGHIYERWAITKWLAENKNRSPLTNVVIAPDLVVLTDRDEGVGARHVMTPKDSQHHQQERQQQELPESAIPLPSPTEQRVEIPAFSTEDKQQPSNPDLANGDETSRAAAEHEETFSKEQQEDGLAEQLDRGAQLQPRRSSSAESHPESLQADSGRFAAPDCSPLSSAGSEPLDLEVEGSDNLDDVTEVPAGTQKRNSVDEPQGILGKALAAGKVTQQTTTGEQAPNKPLMALAEAKAYERLTMSPGFGAYASQERKAQQQRLRRVLAFRAR